MHLIYYKLHLRVHNTYAIPAVDLFDLHETKTLGRLDFLRKLSLPAATDKPHHLTNQRAHA